MRSFSGSKSEVLLVFWGRHIRALDGGVIGLKSVRREHSSFVLVRDIRALDLGTHWLEVLLGVAR